MTRLNRRRWRDDEGSIVLELVVLAPAFTLIVAMLVFAGRVALASHAVAQAADEAARAASIARTQPEANRTAAAAARATLSQQHLDCITTQVGLDTSGFGQPVGTPANVGATVTCVVRLSDLAVPGVPGSRTVTATGSSPLDTYRER
jgi:Flp pilus assembly protein TadG